MTSVFITGAGTDIGKTYVATLLIRQLRARGVTVDAVKPVASGFDPARAEQSDPGLLLGALDAPLTAATLERASPWRFREPLSPDMAAAREHREIGFDSLVEFCARPVARGIRLIEGIGGVMVPLDERHTVLDLIEASGTPALLVGGSYLGSISHTLTAAQALGSRGIDIAGIVVNESADQPVPTCETARVLERFLPGLAVVELERERAGSPHRAPDLSRLLDSFL